MEEKTIKYNDLFLFQQDIANKHEKRFSKLPLVKLITKKINEPSKEKPKKQYKWAVTSLEENYKFDRATADGTDKLDNLDWENEEFIKGVER